jgi:hypothetical protein
VQNLPRRAPLAAGRLLRAPRQLEQCPSSGSATNALPIKAIASHIAGTIFENTNKPLRQWFKVVHLMTTGKKRLRKALTALAAESAHRMTAVAAFILLTDIGDQHLRALHLDFEGSDQRIFRVNNNVFRLPLKFETDRKLHLRPPLSVKRSTIQ